MQFSIVNLVLLVCVLVSTVAGHGHMISPPIRIPPGDQNNGLTITRGPNPGPCAGLKPGPVMRTFNSGQTFTMTWEIGAAHQGPCFMELSTTGRDTDFRRLKQFNCGDRTGNNFKTSVTLPKGVKCNHCTLRFRWDAKLTNEKYNNCADIRIR